MRLGISGDDHHATGFTIQAVDDPQVTVMRFKDVSDVGKILIITIGNRKEPAGFIDQDNIHIFV